MPQGEHGLFRLSNQGSQNATASASAGAALPQQLGGVQGLPSAGRPAGAHKYLIETNPALTDLKQFMSSDYLLGNLGYDTDATQKRLGDGLYEQRLVREAIVARTGQRYLAGLTSDEAMFRYLMDNAIASKDALGLSLGVSLTAEQVAALTHDIVWMEEHEVMGEKVLVPVLYLAQAKGRLASTGALIQGRDVSLISGGSLNNQGTLRASQNLDVTASNITNGGLMQANERLQLLATDSIRNTAGGIIAGRDVSAIALTGDIINERSVTTHLATRGASYQDRQDFADSAARIEAGNNLQLSAGRDLLNMGSAISAGGDASLTAGRDLVIASQQEEDAFARKDRKSQTSQQVITQHASDVKIGGDLTLQADRDLAVIGSKVEAGGDMALEAGENITLASAANESHFEHHRKGGGKKVDIVRDSVTQQSAELTAGGNLAVQSGKDTSVVASSVKAGEEAYFYAGGDISLLAADDQSYSYYYKKKKSGGLISSKKTTLSEASSSQAVSSSILAGANLTLVADNDLTLQGAKLSSNEAIVAFAGHDIVLDAAENTASQASGKSKSRLFSSKASTKSTDSTSLTSTSLDGKSVELLADNDITLRAAAVHAEEDIILDAGRDVVISTAQQSQQSSQASKSNKLSWHLTDSLATNGSFTLENKAKGGEQRTVQEMGSTLSGGTIAIDSGRDTAIRGSTLVADSDIRIDAARHLSVVSGEASNASSASSKTKNIGEIGNWYQGATGVASLKEANTNSSVTQTASQIASLGGNVDLTAGERYNQVASHVIAPTGDINIVGKQVDIEAGYDKLSATQKQSSSRTAVGGSVSVPLVDAVRNIQQMSDAAGDTGDTRLKTLAAVNTAMNAQRGYEAAQAMETGNLTGIKVSVNLSNSKSNSRSTQSGQNVVGSTIAAGGDVNISAVGDGKNSNLNVVGSKIEAVHNVDLKADGDINLLSAQNTAQQRGDNSNSGWSVGVGFGLGSQNGFTLDLAANKGKGYSDGESITHSNTTVSAGNTVKIDSGKDTNLKGAVVQANQVTAEVGGDLNLASQQDIDNYKSEQKDASVGISVCIPPFCYGVSGSAAFGQQKIDSSYASVIEQTGIKAGDGGFQVDVEGNTDLKGAVITSTDKAVADGKNSLTTGTLTHSDIENKAEYDATSLNLSGGFSIGREDGEKGGAPLGKDQDGNISTAGGGERPPSTNGVSASAPIALSASGEDSSSTRSGISAGTIVITNEAKQKELTGQSADEAVADINRDVSSQKDGSNALGKIFDREEVEAGFVITRQFVQNVGTLLEDRARQADAAKAAAEVAEAKSRDPSLTDEQRQVYRDRAITLQEQAQAINKDWGAGSPYRQVATALVAAASGNVTGANGEFVRSMVVNYVQQQGAGYIGDLVGKGELTEGSPIHAALHAIVGCAGAAASQQSCSAGALGGAASSVLAGLFDETSPDETAEQREAKRNIITSLVTGIAVLRDPGDATTASGAAIANVDNNWLATQQKVQRDKELAQAASPLEELAVHAKWSRVSVGQDVDTGVGIAKGLKDGLAGTGLETLNGFANFMRDPVEQWNNLAKLASTDAIKQALGDGYEAFQAEVQLVQKQLETGGGDNAEALGHRMGSIIGIVLGTVSTGGASTARAGQVLSDIGIVVRSSKTAQVIAASKGKALTYLERLKRDGHDSDVPDIVDAEKEALDRIAQNPKEPDLTGKQPGTVLQMQSQKRIDDLAVQYNTKSIEPKDFQLNLGGKILKTDPQVSKGAPVYMGATSSDVMSYFRQLAGVENMPLAREIPGRGTLYTAKTGTGAIITLRDYSRSAQQTGASWTIDVTDKSINRGRKVEIKFK